MTPVGNASFLPCVSLVAGKRARQMNVSKRGSAGWPGQPGRRRGGRWLPGLATARAAMAGAAAVVLFAALAAVGLAAGAALTATPASPSLPPALAPAPEAVLDHAAASGSPRTVLLTNGARVATITSGLRVGGPGRTPAHLAHRPGHGQRRCHRLRPGAPSHGRLSHGRLSHGRLSHGRLNGASRDGGQIPKTRGARWPAAPRNVRMEAWLGSISTEQSTSAT
jgi:hypothetical protein